MAKDNNILKMENDKLRKNLYEKSLEMDKLKVAIKSLENKEKESGKKIIELQKEIEQYKKKTALRCVRGKSGHLEIR